jgi:CRISPR/Cas system Type II protein with McrA/HNH and RuvC-like nuclease domain
VGASVRKTNRRYRLYNNQCGYCAYCLNKVEIQNSTVDHIVPKSKIRKQKFKSVVQKVLEDFETNYVMDTNSLLVRKIDLPQIRKERRENAH